MFKTHPISEYAYFADHNYPKVIQQIEFGITPPCPIKKNDSKYLFNQYIVMRDCNLSNFPELADNTISPIVVFGTYNISGTRITDLKDAPRFAFKGANIKKTPLAKKIGQDFLSPQEYNKLWISHNQTSNLIHTPTLTRELAITVSEETDNIRIFQAAIINNSTLTKFESTKGKNFIVLGAFDCSQCPQLKSLKNLPAFIGGNLDISGTKVSTLKGAIKPNRFKGNFICDNTPLAKRTGKSFYTTREYYLLWQKDNIPTKHRIHQHMQLNKSIYCKEIQ